MIHQASTVKGLVREGWRLRLKIRTMGRGTDECYLVHKAGAMVLDVAPSVLMRLVAEEALVDRGGPHTREFELKGDVR